MSSKTKVSISTNTNEKPKEKPLLISFVGRGGQRGVFKQGGWNDTSAEGSDAVTPQDTPGWPTGSFPFFVRWL